jgi:hypothetical protein
MVTEARRILAAIDRCRDDPCGFHEHVLGRPRFHARQAEIARACVANRVVVCPGAHQVGKSWAAASLILWWLYTRRPSKVVVTSPAYSQLIGVMWEAVRAAYTRSRLPLGPSRALLHESLRLGPDHYAVALSTNEPERLQGHHGPAVMVVTDESSLIRDEIWAAIESLGYVLLLILGNPIRARCRFRDYYRRARQGIHGYAYVHLTAFDSPHAHLTDEQVRAGGLPAGLTSRTWIDSVRVMYGEHSPYWLSRVLAEFPDSDELVVFPEAWLERCADDAIRPRELGRSRWIACDPAGGTGRDRSGLLVRDEHRVLALESSADWGLSDCADRISTLQRLYRVPSDHIVYDATGLGLGLDGHLAMKGIHDAIPFKGGESGGMEWTNMRTAAAMSARARLNPALANHRPFYCPPEVLAQLKPELEQLKLLPDRTDARRQQLEAKEELVKRLGRSPDLGDVFCISFVAGADLPGLPLIVNEREASYADAADDEILTSDQRTLRMAGLL